MGADSIGFTTRYVAGHGGEDLQSSSWSAQVIAKRTVDEAEFFAAVAERTRQSVADVGYIFSTAGTVLRDFLRQGCRVNLSDVGFGLTITGKFPSEDAALPPAGSYRLEVRARNGAAASFAPAVVRKSVEVK